MRIRAIKPEYWRSPDIMPLTPFQKLLYIGLWNFADDEGRGEYQPAAIAADLFLHEYSLNPHGVLNDVSNAFQIYEKQGMVTLYKHNGRAYFTINNWQQHQRINRPTKSRLPAPTPDSHTTHAQLTEPSLNPHTHNTEPSPQEQGTGNREQGRGETLQPSYRSKKSYPQPVDNPPPFT